MTTLDKRWARNQFRHAKNSAIFAASAMSLMNSDAVHNLRDRSVLMKPEGIIFNPDPVDHTGDRIDIDLGQIAREYDTERTRHQDSLKEYWKASRRNLLKESFEVVEAYADAAGCFKALQAEPWYPFARVIRNSISHDMHFRFRPYDLKQLPVSWRGTTITAALHDTDMTENFLDPYMVWNLHMLMEAFVEAH